MVHPPPGVPVEDACPACAARALHVFFTEDSVPRNSCLLLDDQRTATGFRRGTLRIAWCTNCGFVTNVAFTPGDAEYSQRYEETQGFSGTFLRFAEDLAKRWVSDYALAERTVLEIGCGKGEFLVMMAEAGAGHCIGIDPGVHPERIQSGAADRLEWIVDFYDERYGHLHADAVVCRHTLEHIPDVSTLMTTIRRTLGERRSTIVLFELPDIQRILDEAAFWDIYFEHCSYFSAGSLARLFSATGFDVLDVRREYDDQYLLIEARPGPAPGKMAPVPIVDDLDAVRAGVTRFVERYTATVTHWRQRIDAVVQRGGTVVLWGSGSKGVSFLSNLGLAEEIAGAVDINPHKWGKYMVGSGHRILAPTELVELRPDLVVVMNPIYVPEISEMLSDLGVDSEVAAL